MLESKDKTLMDIKKEVLNSNLSDESKIYIIENLSGQVIAQVPYSIKEYGNKPRGLDIQYSSSPNTSASKC